MSCIDNIPGASHPAHDANIPHRRRCTTATSTRSSAGCTASTASPAPPPRTLSSLCRVSPPPGPGRAQHCAAPDSIWPPPRQSRHCRTAVRPKRAPNRAPGLRLVARAAAPAENFAACRRRRRRRRAAPFSGRCWLRAFVCLCDAHGGRSQPLSSRPLFASGRPAQRLRCPASPPLSASGDGACGAAAAWRGRELLRLQRDWISGRRCRGLVFLCN